MSTTGPRAPQHATPPAKKRKRGCLIPLLAAVAVLALCVVGTIIAALDGDTPTGAAQEPTTAATPASVASPPAPAKPARAADNALLDQIGGLTVAAENRTGYDRDLFGDYDRPALLKQNFAAWPDCDGYYSLADDQCYTKAGEVDVDHIVALGEAWDSGASKWTSMQRDQYAGHTANLWLMTDNLNQSKGDEDAAEWLPPYGPAVCGYVTAYVAVKAEWHLSVDRAEKTELVEAAQGCGVS